MAHSGSNKNTDAPTKEPSNPPTKNPLEEGETHSPTIDPTKSPSEEPTKTPTEVPSKSPSEEPSKNPSEEPSKTPTEDPSDALQCFFIGFDSGAWIFTKNEDAMIVSFHSRSIADEHNLCTIYLAIYIFRKISWKLSFEKQYGE